MGLFQQKRNCFCRWLEQSLNLCLHPFKSDLDLCCTWILLDVQKWLDNTQFAEPMSGIIYDRCMLVRFIGLSHAAREHVLAHTPNTTMLKLNISSSGRSCLEEVHRAIFLAMLDVDLILFENYVVWKLEIWLKQLVCFPTHLTLVVDNLCNILMVFCARYNLLPLSMESWTQLHVMQLKIYV